MSRITTDLFDTYKEMVTGKILNEETDSVNEAYFPRRPQNASPFRRPKGYYGNDERKLATIPDSVIQRMDAARAAAEEEEKRKREQQKTEEVQEADAIIAKKIEKDMVEAKDNSTYHFKPVKSAPYLEFKSGNIVGHTVSSTGDKGANILKHKTGKFYAAGGSSTAFTNKTTLHDTPEDAAKAYHKGKLAEGLETITINFVVENTYQVDIPSSITYQDYLNAINTIIDSDDENIQAEIISIANEAFENNEFEIIAEAELIKQGIIESAYKRTKEGDIMRSPELKGMVNREKPGVVKFTRDLASTTGESKKEAGSRRREDKKQASPNAVKRSTVRAAGMKPGPVTIIKFK